MTIGHSSRRKLLRIFSAIILICFLISDIAGAYPASAKDNSYTLAAPTVFTGLSHEDTFFVLASGYLSRFLLNIENDPKNQSVASLRTSINKELRKIKNGSDIPDKDRILIPDKVTYEPYKAAVLLDLGPFKVRYFNHNIPDAEFPEKNDPGNSYKVLQEKVGKYLTRQIIIQRELTKKSHWHDRRIDIALPKERIRDNLSKVVEMAPKIIAALPEHFKPYQKNGLYNNIMNVDIDEYIGALDIFSEMAGDTEMTAGKLEEYMLKFYFYMDETANKVKDTYGYHDVKGAKKVQEVILSIFNPKNVEEIEKDPIRFSARAFVDIVNAQAFHNGNHRAADIVMNFILIKNGLPYFMLNENNAVRYYQLTNNYDITAKRYDIDEITEFFRAEIQKKKGDILAGLDTILKEDELKYGAFARKKFQERREKDDGDTFSYTTITTELEGMVKLGILKTNRKKWPFEYELTEIYRAAKLEELIEVKFILDKLPARPNDIQLKAAGRFIKNVESYKMFPGSKGVKIKKDKDLLSYYLREVPKINLELIRLYTERARLSNLPGLSVDAAQKIEECTQRLNDIREILSDKLSGMPGPSYFIGITFDRDYRKEIRENIKKAVEYIDERNEPAACTLLWTTSQLLAEELLLISKAGKGKRKKRVWFDTKRKMWTVLKGQYVKHALEDETEKGVFIKEKSVQKTELLWQALRARDREINGMLDERDLIKGKVKKISASIEKLEKSKETAEKLREDMKITDEDKEELHKLLLDIWGYTRNAIVEEKEIAAGAARSALDLLELSEYRSMLELLKVINTLLLTRCESLEGMINNVIRGRLGDLRHKVHSRNSYYIWKTDMVTSLVERGKKEEADKLILGMLRDKDTRNEPEFYRMNRVLGKAHSDLSKPGSEEDVKKMMSIMKQRVRSAELLDSFMEDFRDTYVDARLKDSPDKNIDDLFEIKFDQYLDFARDNDIGRGSPRLIRALFYLAAHISMNMPDPEKPSKKIKNPLFTVCLDLVRILEFKNISALVRSLSREQKKYRHLYNILKEYQETEPEGLDLLTKTKYNGLLKALSLDFELNAEQERKLLKIFENRVFSNQIDPRSELKADEIKHEEMKRQFINIFSEKRMFNWSFKGEEIAAEIEYDDIFDNFIVSPTKEHKDTHPELEVLDLPASMEDMPPSGSFGQIVVKFENINGKLAMLFDEVHPGFGYRELKPTHIRNRYRLWAETAIEKMIEVGRDEGIVSFYVSNKERIRERYKRQGITIPEINLWENYSFPFKNKGWEAVVVSVKEKDNIELWEFVGSKETVSTDDISTSTVMGGMRDTLPRVVDTLITAGHEVSVSEIPGETGSEVFSDDSKGKVGIFIDERLGSGSADVIIDAMEKLAYRNDILGKLLSNVVIKRGDVTDVSRGLEYFEKKKNIGKENMVIITRDEDISLLKDYEDISVITKVDDTKMQDDAYYDMVSIILFTLARMEAFEYTKNDLVKMYNSILNAEELTPEEIFDLYWDGLRNRCRSTIVIKLGLPDAYAVTADTDLYKKIADYIEQNA
ncbi:MAG: hypothetical protein ABH862_00555 [Candidatus Omnitrophota bacterium]